MEESETKRPDVSLIFWLIKYTVIYVSYNFLVGAVLTSLTLTLFVIINLYKGNLDMVTFGWWSRAIRWGYLPESINLNQFQIMDIYSKISLCFFVIGTGISKGLTGIFKNYRTLTTTAKYKLGVITIILLTLLTVASTYSPNALPGVRSFWPLFVGLGLMATICYSVYTGLGQLAEMIGKLTKITPKNKIILNNKVIGIINRLMPDYEQKLRKFYEEAVKTGKWEESKQKMDPKTAEMVEKYYKSQ